MFDLMIKVIRLKTGRETIYFTELDILKMYLRNEYKLNPDEIDDLLDVGEYNYNDSTFKIKTEYKKIKVSEV